MTEYDGRVERVLRVLDSHGSLTGGERTREHLAEKIIAELDREPFPSDPAVTALRVAYRSLSNHDLSAGWAQAMLREALIAEPLVSLSLALARRYEANGYDVDSTVDNLEALREYCGKAGLL